MRYCKKLKTRKQLQICKILKFEGHTNIGVNAFGVKDDEFVP